MIIPSSADLCGRYRVTERHAVQAQGYRSGGPVGQAAEADRRRDVEAGLQADGRAPGAALRPGPLVGAADLPGDGCGRQGQHHQARHARRQSAGLRGPLVQGALVRGARPRFPVAHRRARCPAAATLASSIARTTRRRSWCASTRTSSRASSCRASWSPRTSGVSASKTSTPWSATCRARACWCVSSSCTCRRTNNGSVSWSGSTEPEKHWKFSPADVAERAHFDEYMSAYEDTIRHTATTFAVVSSCRPIANGSRGSSSRRRSSTPFSRWTRASPKSIPRSAREFKKLKAHSKRGRLAKSPEGQEEPKRPVPRSERRRGPVAPKPAGEGGCAWAGADQLYVRYHDEEWGRPVTDDRRLFEKICLEGFQSGLSWITILRKRENFRRAFKDFEPAGGRALWRARRAAPAEGRRHRPASRQDRIDDQQREARARADRREGLAGRVLLVVGAAAVGAAEALTRAQLMKMSTTPQSIALSKDLKAAAGPSWDRPPAMRSCRRWAS